jgi:hypothetical protein
MKPSAPAFAAFVPALVCIGLMWAKINFALKMTICLHSLLTTKPPTLAGATGWANFSALAGGVMPT